MRSLFPKFLCFFCALFSFIALYAQSDSLDSYVQRLKLSKASGGNETAFLSVGSDFLYAQEYFEAGNFSSAAYSFEGVIRREKDHPYANYQLAVSLLRQKDDSKAAYAKTLLAHAFKLQPGLQIKFEKEFPSQPVKSIDANVEAQTPSVSTSITADGLSKYIEQIKYARSVGAASTAMLTAGLDAFYGIEYYEAGEYRSAETNFTLSLAKDPANPYVNYLKAVSLAAIGKSDEAAKFLAKAAAGDATLQNRFNEDALAAKRSWKKKEDSKTIKPTSPETKTKIGGKLHYGNYTCHVSVWNGPNATPAYRQDYKGYFALKSNGSYRWLDNGTTGNFKYNASTGELTWLSGYFKAAQPKDTRFKIEGSYAHITIEMTDNYRWECGCKL